MEGIDDNSQWTRWKCAKNIVFQLVGFHTEMSLLGSIGHLMGGSGLQDVLELFYASSTVVHVLSGKAIAWAIKTAIYGRCRTQCSNSSQLLQCAHACFRDEQQPVVWSLAMPACAEVNRAMQELTGVSFNSREQNKDMAQSRQARDWKDIQTLLIELPARMRSFFLWSHLAKR